MLTVVSWNLNSWQRRSPGAMEATWSFLRDELRADVALVQEATPPPFAHSLIGTLNTGPTMPWGAGIVNLSTRDVTELKEVRQPDRKAVMPLTWHQPGTAAAAVVEGDLTLVSLYGLFVGGSSYQTMLRHAADLAPLLDDSHLARRILIAGDFNLTTQWTGTNGRYNAIESTILSTFTAWGLRDLISESSMEASPDCGCDGTICRHVQTHRHSRSQRPWQVDYAFASAGLDIEIEIRHDALDQNLSDHAPLVMRLA